eukprot:CAMPEP_0115277400 /NCGR_PEP_ID=MMETSP0270-20121206/57219_1 /TAXON_ID=71861 /ORGANISM="Scrippsiella trochoidea, Strain CCMP3099" /LENGTH=152 /DNA_ID=CAMNT_0002694037 /DNA_START=479 /DNA_END=934 /DNA_ORIENTATION=-
MPSRDILEDEFKHPAHDPALLVRLHGCQCGHWSLHRVGLSATCLPIHVYAAVVPIQACIGHASANQLEDLLLTGTLTKNSVEGKASRPASGPQRAPSLPAQCRGRVQSLRVRSVAEHVRILGCCLPGLLFRQTAEAHLEAKPHPLRHRHRHP